MKNNRFKQLNWLVLIGLLICVHSKLVAQQSERMLRIAKITVDPAQLDKYRIALNEQMITAIRQEPGVLSYYAVADKKTPSHITIFEIYADEKAYNTHIQTAHFKKYKERVKNMVKSLTLDDVTAFAIAKKPDI